MPLSPLPVENTSGGLGAYARPADDRPPSPAFAPGLTGDASAPPLGLAVSGGSDSMAMLHLAARAAAATGQRFEIATVDHRLRPEAGDEARFVHEQCQRLGLPHQTLIWEDHPGTGNLMQEGSRARYRLLGQWACQRGISRIALAHTADDQAECFLMGLTRAAGLDGLSGMRPGWQEAGVTFLRPLLHESRAALRAFLRREGQDWCEDPSNSNPRYLRARMRSLRAALEPAGIGLTQLRETIAHLARAQALLRHETGATFARIGTEEAGALRLERAGFAALHPEMQRRLISAAIRWLSAARHAPRAPMLAHLLERLSKEQPATLGGCRFLFTQSALLICREPRSLGPAVAAPGLWDQRWQITGPLSPDLELRALGAEGLRQATDWRETGLAREILLVSPGLWQGEILVAAPLAGSGAAKWQAKLRQSFANFVLSH
ncbi:tRNA lysidine(34) synthetase TilS [Pseudogemmobacter faecipullorum]|uniref:tRNA(Ile)-lysidine synthase n=1 Tax=Pseudogemmobacter faecipullorum TaxID=2755041 RepID=A0ABS8CGH2_9RHOB|nr:tRNA lysidine(34) synthetase TilS [Pseudogemmobacter faecipullorum]